MLYMEYEALKQDYHDTLNRFKHILDKKEVIFQKTQPHSMSYDEERVSGGERVNKADAYMIDLEKLGKELEVAEFIIDKRLRLLRFKEFEIRKSTDIYDIIYCLRYIDRCRILTIAKKTNYSKTSVNRCLKKIRQNIKDGTQ